MPDVTDEVADEVHEEVHEDVAEVTEAAFDDVDDERMKYLSGIGTRLMIFWSCFCLFSRMERVDRRLLTRFLITDITVPFLASLCVLLSAGFGAFFTRAMYQFCRPGTVLAFRANPAGTRARDRETTAREEISLFINKKGKKLKGV